MLRTFVLFLCALTLPLRAGQLPDQDRRNTEIRHTDTHYQMPEYRNRRAWEERAAFLRKQILFSAGLWPMPEKTPLSAQVFGEISHDDYSVERVVIETYPGFFLGGNLYRPAGKPGPHPGIVSPHGHWRYGRLENSELGSIPARGINLARQGFVVFTYDMVGYGDTIQLPHKLETRHEELWSIGLLGLQLWNSIRAVDFLSSLSGVDSSRLAATGASGGGTQTFLLSAVDDRIRFSAPVNMISAIMQGGSLCENAANLRIDTHNVEIAALMAPRPMLMVSASGDWTRNTPVEEFPAVQGVYRQFDAEGSVESVQIDAPHNYNQQSREAVYGFFNRRVLDNSDESSYKEKPYQTEQLSRMLAFWGRELPGHALGRGEFVTYLREQAQKQIDARQPQDSPSLASAQEYFREALSLSIMASLPAPNDLASDLVDDLPSGELLVMGRRDKSDRVPAVILHPRRRNEALPPALLVHPEGTAWVLSSSERPGGLAYELLARGVPVMGIDVFQTGRAKASRDIAGAGQNAVKFFTTFNRTDDANRVQDILTALTYLRTRLNSREVHLAGLGMAGVWSLFARALADEQVHLIADLMQFETGSDEEYLEKLFIPGLRKSGDFRAALALLPSGKTLLHNAAPSFPYDWADAGFQAAGAGEKLEVRRSLLSEEELIESMAPRQNRRRR